VVAVSLVTFLGQSDQQAQKLQNRWISKIWNPIEK
jgi:hypothetical protein